MFTQREIEVLTLIAEGHDTEAISNLLNRTRETVKSHRKNIRMKLKDRGIEVQSLTAFAVQYIRKVNDLH